MLSLNFVDLFDKILSLPNKDRETSLVKYTKYAGAQNLMNGKLDMYQHMPNLYDQVENENGWNLIENGWINPEYSVFEASNLNTKVNNGIHRIIGQSCKRPVPKVTFSHYIKAIPDFLRIPIEHSDMLFSLADYLNFNSNFKCDKTTMNSAILTDLTGDPNINYKDTTGFNTQNLVEESMNDHICNSNSEVAHSYENVTQSDMTGNNMTEPSGNHKLNQQLANRKAKELHKRSKKRRRRQKKVRHPDLKLESGGNTEKVKIHTSEAAIDVVDSICKPLKNSSHLSDCKHCKRNDCNCDITSCSSKKEKDDFIFDIVSVEDITANTVQICLPDFSSFLISVESVGDDDSDWDTSSDADWLPITTEFELSGLFVTNLTTSRTNDSPTAHCEFVTVNCCDDLEELKNLETVLNEVNRNWNEATKEIDKKPRLPSKVSFAPDNELVEVMSVEIYDRKGEWERYATERMRFRRRIDELEKVLSPCLSTDHRSKIFELYHPQL